MNICKSIFRFCILLTHLRTNKDEKEKDEESEKTLMEAMGSLLHRDEVGSAKVKLADVAGLKEAKDALYQAILQPIRFKDHFEGAREPWKGILLYGVREKFLVLYLEILENFLHLISSLWGH